jgi:hypothetical protein
MRKREEEIGGLICGDTRKESGIFAYLKVRGRPERDDEIRKDWSPDDEHDTETEQIKGLGRVSGYSHNRW